MWGMLTEWKHDEIKLNQPHSTGHRFSDSASLGSPLDPLEEKTIRRFLVQ
jgi:hypothetical protein